MKLKASKKEFKGLNVLRVGGYGLQETLRGLDAFGYSAGAYGWSCDYYDLGGLIISQGYSAIGKPANYETLKQYEEIARRINTNDETNYQEKQAQLHSLREDFKNDLNIFQ